MVSKLTQIETEGMHYEQLLHALSKFREAAARREWDIGWLQNATQHAVAIGTYREDNRWIRVAAMLDELGKKPPGNTELVSTLTTHLDHMIEAVKKLRDRRLN
jgi:hypothetical protein